MTGHQYPSGGSHPTDGAGRVPGNRLLSALPRDEFERLRSSLQTISLERNEVLYKDGTAIGRVYFPTSGVCSITTSMQDGATVEAAAVGNEGMLGVTLSWGGDSMPGETVVQVAGEAEAMTAQAFKRELDYHGALFQVIGRYAQALLAQVMQANACNRLHSVDLRCAKWLLMTHDRVGVDRFHLTQEYLAAMLGVRRASVTVAAGTLQNAGIIQYSQGMVTLLDRKRLEHASCECYRAVRSHFERLLPSS